MEAEDFEELYKLVRGNRAATAVTDARALFMEKKFAETLQKLLHAKETFAESRSRMIRQDVEKQVDPKAKDADRQVKKLKRKQDKVLDAIKIFDEMIPGLQKMISREQERLAKRPTTDEAVADAVTPKSDPKSDQEPESNRQLAPQAPTDLPPAVPAVLDPTDYARPEDVTAEFAKAFLQSEGDQQLDVIDRMFSFQAVKSEQDIHPETLYFIRTSESSYLVSTPSAAELHESVALRSVVDKQSIKPFSRNAFVKLGLIRKMVLLVRKEMPHPEDLEEEVAEGSWGEEGEHDSGPDGEIAKAVIDMAAFSQLLSAAQRTQIVPGADQIAHVRDREFRMGKYDLAFQSIDALFAKFMGNASQRLQRLRQEDTDIASGRIKMASKDLLVKRQRDRMQTQEIDRAQRRFQVVLEGLRILMNTELPDRDTDDQ